jgi:hypothetical protein
MTLNRIQIVCASIVTLSVSMAAPAYAQLFEVTQSTDPSLGAYWGSGAAYDPIHDCYFVVSGEPSVGGRFISRDGVTLGAVTFDAREGFADVAYSPDVGDGAGGFGGFVAIWTMRQVPGLFGQVVSLPGGRIGPVVTIRPTQPIQFEFKAGVAYSPIDHVFLVGVASRDYDLITNQIAYPTRILRLNLNAQPLDDSALTFDPSHSCHTDEFTLGCDEVDVVWNPISHEFGVLYNQDLQRTLARVSGNGTVVSRTPLGISPAFGALAVNATTGNYLAIGGSGGNLFSEAVTDGAEVSPGGAVLARGLVTVDLETAAVGAGLMKLSYSSASGTFLLAGRAITGPTRLLELNQHGVPVGATVILDDHPVVIASHPVAPEWLATTLRGTRYIIGTATPFGGSDARLSNCATPDPFVALGGGRCINDGWYPPIASPPPPVFGGCIPPDPFAVLGGGRCVNGGWYPPILPSSPPPSPGPGGCVTPDPFVAFGGGQCVNGGWMFPTAPAPPPPAPIPGGCITPDPFVALGGGRCVNGGWYPPGS